MGGNAKRPRPTGPEAELSATQKFDSPGQPPVPDTLLQSIWRKSESSSGIGADTFGRYEQVEVIAQGGIGQVLRAYDPEIGRPVAIKILLPEHKGDQQQIQKFRQEAHLTGGLDHPNIVPIHDMGQLPDGSSYFVMKLVQGESLAEIL